MRGGAMDNGKNVTVKKKTMLSAAAARAAANSDKKKKSGGAGEYFRGVRIEIKKVVWPTKKELVSYTAVVLVACVIFGVGIWAIDSGFLLALKTVLRITF
jgi:preprotein translocase subunit SecE